MIRAALLAATVGLVLSTPALAQSRLSVAKGLYLKAEYEEALKVLAEAAVTEPETPAHEAHHYRALCLLALGRTTDSEAAMAAAVEADPFFVPQAADVSPRISRLYADVRQRLLPAIVRRRLTEARERYQDGEYTRALDGFSSVTKLLDEPSLAARDDLSDLRLAASGLSELARLRVASATPTPAPVMPAAPAPAAPAPAVAASPAATPTPAPAAAAAAATSAGTPGIPPAAGPRPAGGAPSTASTTPGVTPAPPAAERATPPAATPAAGAVTAPPKALVQTLPRWNPPDLATARRAFNGSVRVQIDRTGAVTQAAIDRPTHPAYDRLLIEAARTWRYQPALRDGQPVPSETIVEVRLQPAAGQ